MHACQYAPPHEFAVNVPRAMAEVRGSRLTRNTLGRPRLGALYKRKGLRLSRFGRCTLALPCSPWLKGVLGCDAARRKLLSDVSAQSAGGMFGAVFRICNLALAMGVRRFWRDVTPATTAAIERARRVEATKRCYASRISMAAMATVATNERRLHAARRRFHHLTFYGFMLCFAATIVATLYHYAFGWLHPTPFPACRNYLAWSAASA